MLDILGREIHKGDIIAYGSGKSGHIRYSCTRLGIVNNVLGKRTYLASSSMYKKICKDALSNSSNIPHMPASVDTIAKVTFYPINLSDKHLSTHPTFNKIHPNGKPKRGIILTTEFLKVNVEDLSAEWLEVYVEVKKAFRL